ncbi:hypothetical protein ACFZDG_17405 [Kitasatospora xanthocidica]|uniref:hypothetical protein n=1 Tax=Kitasatospora xanthocidica TaxID=83382 RepID=UPI0036DFA4AE
MAVPAPVAPTPPPAPAQRTLPPYLPPASPERPCRRRRLLLIGSALVAVVVAAAGTLGFLVWRNQEHDTSSTAAAGFTCPARHATIGSDGMEAALASSP